MAIEDANPHRRNLVLTTTLCLLFFWTDSELVTGTGEEAKISLAFISAEMHSPHVFGWFVVGLLCFFLWRYWINVKPERHKFVKSLMDEASFDKGIIQRANIIAKITPESYEIKAHNHTGMAINWYSLFDSRIDLQARKIRRICEDGKLDFDGTLKGKFTVHGREGFLLKLRVTWKTILKDESFVNIYFPFFWFIILVTTAAIECYSDFNLCWLCQIIPDCYACATAND